MSSEPPASCLPEGLRWLGFGSVKPAVKSTITQARTRLGAVPMRMLFERLARVLGTDQTKGAWYRSWRTVAFDGTTLALPDIRANAAVFGYPGSSFGGFLEFLIADGRVVAPPIE